MNDDFIRSVLMDNHSLSSPLSSSYSLVIYDGRGKNEMVVHGRLSPKNLLGRNHSVVNLAHTYIK